MTENTVEIVNAVRVSGTVYEEPVYSHEVMGESFFTLLLAVRRNSGTNDLVPIEVSERAVDIENIKENMCIQITGTFRSYNSRKQEGVSHLLLYVFADQLIEISENEVGMNEIILEGHICKEPVYRRTPLGRDIADVLLAVNRNYGKSDYIPCIVWGRNAIYAEGLKVGTHIRCKGRIQSRVYLKNGEERTAYEVSVTSINCLD